MQHNVACHYSKPSSPPTAHYGYRRTSVAASMSRNATAAPGTSRVELIPLVYPSKTVRKVDK